MSYKSYTEPGFLEKLRYRISIFKVICAVYKPFEVFLPVFVPIVVVFAVLPSLPVLHIPKPNIEKKTKKKAKCLIQTEDITCIKYN